MSEPLILEDRQDRVVVLTLNRPEVMNSFNFPMLLALKERVEALHFDPEVRVVIIVGAGPEGLLRRRRSERTRHHERAAGAGVHLYDSQSLYLH